MRLRLGPALCALFGIVALLAGMRDYAPAEQLRIVLSGELKGYLSPCGCSKPMIGGVARRGTYLESLQKSGPTVRIEGGNFTQALTRQDELKAETIVDVLNELKYDALCLGRNDFRIGVPYLQALASRFKGATLCANVVGADGKPLFTESTTVERTVEGQKTRIGIAALVSPMYEATIRQIDPGLKVEEPGSALARLTAGLADCSIRVLVFDGPKEDAVSLASEGGFQIVLMTGSEDPKNERLSGVLVVTAGTQGRHLAAVPIDAAGKAGEPAMRALDPDLMDHGGVKRHLAAYLGRVDSEDLLGKMPRLPLNPGEAFAGSSACAPCHEPAERVWKNSLHAKALVTLEKEGHQRDPECVGCHVVGLDKVGGFESAHKTPDLAGVGCESCHGPGERHAKDPGVKMGKVGAASCAPCHVPEHSPKFDFDTYWKRIEH